MGISIIKKVVLSYVKINAIRQHIGYQYNTDCVQDKSHVSATRHDLYDITSALNCYSFSQRLHLVFLIMILCDGLSKHSRIFFLKMVGYYLSVMTVCKITVFYKKLSNVCQIFDRH